MIELLQASDLRSLVQHCVVIALCVTAFVWGGGPERAAIATWCICFELAPFVYIDLLDLPVLLSGFSPFHATKEICAGLLWMAVALYANRNYTLWIAGVQLLAIGANVAQLMTDAISPIGFLFLIILPGWFQLLFMSIGFARHIRRKRKYGPYRDWRGLYPQQVGVASSTHLARFLSFLGKDFVAERSQR